MRDNATKIAMNIFTKRMDGHVICAWQGINLTCTTTCILKHGKELPSQVKHVYT